MRDELTMQVRDENGPPRLPMGRFSLCMGGGQIGEAIRCQPALLPFASWFLFSLHIRLEH